MRSSKARTQNDISTGQHYLVLMIARYRPIHEFGRVERGPFEILASFSRR